MISSSPPSMSAMSLIREILEVKICDKIKLCRRVQRQNPHSSFLCNSLQYYYFHFRIRISNLTLWSVTLQPCIQPHRGLAFELKVKWQKLLKNLCRMQLRPTVAISARTRAQELIVSRDTCGNIREKSLSNAINVATLVQQLVDSRNTCWLIRVRSLSVVHNVTTLAHQLVTSRNTWGFTQGKIPLAAHNATTLAKKLVDSGNTYWHTLQKITSCAHNVTSQANMLTALRDTFGPIQEWNLSSVTSATFLALCLVVWKYTGALTPEKNPTLAINVVSQASQLATFSSTWQGSTESNQMLEKKTACFFWLYHAGAYNYVIVYCNKRK